ncbi:YagK/YfjJ domain-containing protein [Lelliottia nimipressuralis]|uniref:YagK/YfjJ domain-containing protein n=1 Tax=Lelliottia nimipressuralis TaxID=69220 RepID=UPI0028A284CB|nr:inovirus-type Gp2 protein [Lelliottia nimipressuralis]
MKDKTTVFNNISPAKSPFDYPPQGQYCFGDVLWPVLPAERDQDANILKRIFETIEQASLQSSRFLAIRYDFHLKEYSSDNKAISRFHSLVFPCLWKKYPRSFISFFWVREQAESDPQHYHYLLMPNGNVVKHSKRVNQIVMACWEQANRGTCWVPDNCYYLVKDISSHRDLLMRTSYLGKKRTKETIGKGIKRFGCGLRKPKPTKRKATNTTRIATLPLVPKENTVNQLDGMNRYPGYLDAYFTGDASLLIYHQPSATSTL